MKTEKQILEKIMYLESLEYGYTQIKRPTPGSIISMIQTLYWVIEK